MVEKAEWGLADPRMVLVDLTELAVSRPEAYSTFNEFFYRYVKLIRIAEVGRRP